MSVRIITDPLENILYLPSKYDLKSFGADCLDEDISLIIKVPAFIITVFSPEPQLCHYRSVGWNLTLMFKSVKEKDHWIVIDCIKNPGIEMLHELLSKGEIVTFRG